MKRLFGFTFLAVVLIGCSMSDGDAKNHPFAIDVDVVTEPGHGIAGVELVARGEKVAVTDDKGHAQLLLGGSEGDSVAIAVRCPAGFESPNETIAISLRRFSTGSAAPSFSARCAPLVRTVVVGIRAENGNNLPVMVLGKEVGRTDAAGAAHIVLEVKPNEQVSVALDTKSRGDAAPKLRPENPTMTFVAKEHGDFVVLEQKFDIEKAPPHPKGRAPRSGPTRI